MGKLSTTSRVQVYNRLKHTAKDLRISAQALNTQWEQTACGCKLQMYHCVTRMTNLNGVFFFLFYIIRLLRVVARVRENDSDGNSRSANWLREANTRRAWEKYTHTKLTFGRLIVDARQCTSLTNLSYMCSLLTSAGSSVTDLTCWIGNRGINSSVCLSIIGSCQLYSKFCEVCLVRALWTIRPQHSDKQILHSLSVCNQADRVHREGILHHHQRSGPTFSSYWPGAVIAPSLTKTAQSVQVNACEQKQWVFGLHHEWCNSRHLRGCDFWSNGLRQTVLNKPNTQKEPLLGVTWIFFQRYSVNERILTCVPTTLRCWAEWFREILYVFSKKTVQLLFDLQCNFWAKLQFMRSVIISLWHSSVYSCLIGTLIHLYSESR